MPDDPDANETTTMVPETTTMPDDPDANETTTMVPETTTMPDDPDANETTTMVPETTTMPMTTVAPDPSLTLEQCQGCLTMCAPCRECADGDNTTFAYGDCEKCWSCWNFGKDKLHKSEKKMAKHC